MQAGRHGGQNYGKRLLTGGEIAGVVRERGERNHQDRDTHGQETQVLTIPFLLAS